MRRMLRQNLSRASCGELAVISYRSLYVGLEVGVDALYGIAEPREDLLMLPRDIARYIRNFRYYIGTSEQQALDLFRHYLQRLEP